MEFKKIKNIKIKYPEATPNLDKFLDDLYSKMCINDAELHDLRIRVRDAECKNKELFKIWNDFSDLADVEYEEKIMKPAINNDVKINIINEKDYRNKH